VAVSALAIKITIQWLCRDKDRKILIKKIIERIGKQKAETLLTKLFIDAESEGLTIDLKNAQNELERCSADQWTS